MEEKLKNLLNLQAKDLEKRQIEISLAQLPEEVRQVELKINTIREEDKKRIGALQQMEVDRKRVNNELKAEEEKIVKYKTQQIDVKKNEEYEALTAQIQLSTERVGALEDEELNLLMAIDEQKKKTNEESERAKAAIQDLEKKINSLKAHGKELEGKLLQLKQEYEAARAQLPAMLLSKYDQVVRQVKKGPFVVALEGQRCMGCHLTVSNEVVSAVKKWTDGTVPQCDSCSRILYLC